MKKILIFSLFVGSISCEAQLTFQKVIGRTGNDGLANIRQTFDGGYIIAATTDALTAGSSDVYIIKTDSAGDTLWTKTFGGISADQANNITQTTDSGFVLTGITLNTVSGDEDLILIRLNSFGDSLWTKEYAKAFGRSIVQTYDGGFIITGGRTSPGITYSDAYLIRTDAWGDTLWTKQYGMPGNPDFASSVKQTNDSGFIICGWMNNIYSYLVRVDAIGDTLWTRAYGKDTNPVQAQFGEIVQTSDGGFIAIGNSDDLGAGSWDIFVVKTDANGDTLWTRVYGGVGVESGSSIRQTSDGGYIIIGSTNSFGFGNTDVYLLRIDSASNYMWAKSFGGAGYDRGSSVELSSDGGIIIGGITNSFGAGNYDIYFIKTDSLGNSGCHETTANAITTKPRTDRIEYPESINISGTTVQNYNCIIGSGGTTTDLCFTTGVSYNSDELNSNIEFSPNPTTSSVTIFDGKNKIESLALYNIFGEKIMMTEPLESVIDISILPAGVYIVEASSGGKQLRGKVIKQ